MTGHAAGSTRARVVIRSLGVAALASCIVAAAACSDDTSASDLSDPRGIDAQMDAPGQPATPPASIDKVTIAGDSISVGLGSAMREAASDDLTVKVIGQVGSGLARPDDFDWPDRLRELARDYPPDVLVFSLSSNDAQDLVDTDGEVVARLKDDAAWDAEYSARLAASFDAFADTATTVLWVGHVRTEKDTVGLTNRHIQRLAAQVASTRPWVVVDDLATLLDTGDEVADDCLVPDGLHLSTKCLGSAAEQLLRSPPLG